MIVSKAYSNKPFKMDKLKAGHKSDIQGVNSLIGPSVRMVCVRLFTSEDLTASALVLFYLFS